MKALIAMSGGVDSAVAAMLTQQAGFDCIGCTMILYNNEDAGLERGRTCCALSDVEDARSVCFRLGIPHYSFNFKDEFRDTVIRDFVDEYLAGHTPNPCIVCNERLKFGKLMHRAAETDCEYVVTGHYARIRFDGSRYHLLKAADPKKDQSYVLYGLTQAQLKHLRLPLGELTKDAVRAIAASNGFRNAHKPDSQDICFVPDGDYARVVELHAGRTCPPGDMVDKDGHLLGRHSGIIHYTLGQHKGLGERLPGKMFVCAIDAASNRIVLGRSEDLFRREAIVKHMHWICGEAPAGDIRCLAKTRYRHTEQPAAVTPLPDGGARILFDEPQRAITPGQSAVLYDGDEVLGGGILI